MSGAFDMYDLALGDGRQGERAGLFMHVPLNLRRRDFGRYRDCWTEIDENDVLRVAVYTRVGGNNRASYQDNIDLVRTNPFYMFDRDDKFDTTYATFYFRFPTEVPEHLKNLPDGGYTEQTWAVALQVIRESTEELPNRGMIDTDQRWHDALAALEANGMTERQAGLSRPLAEALEQALAMPPDPDGAIPIIFTDGQVNYHLPKNPEEGS